MLVINNFCNDVQMTTWNVLCHWLNEMTWPTRIYAQYGLAMYSHPCGWAS